LKTSANIYLQLSLTHEVSINYKPQFSSYRHVLFYMLTSSCVSQHGPEEGGCMAAAGFIQGALTPDEAVSRRISIPLLTPPDSILPEFCVHWLWGCWQPTQLPSASESHPSNDRRHHL